MTEPPLPVRTFSAEDRRRQRRGLLVFLVPALVMVAIYAATAPLNVPGLLIVFGYLIVVTGALLVLVVAASVLHRLPTIAPGRLDGAPALVVRAWPGQWLGWLAGELAMAVTLLAEGALAIRTGGDYAIWSVPLLVGGTLLLGRVGLAAAGRRHNESLGVTAEALVHQADWGSERCPLGAVTEATASPSGAQILIRSAQPVARRRGPWPWRPKQPREPAEMLVDCWLMGHPADDLADWVLRAARGGAARGARSSPEST